jgi:geranylgeranyl diphosphate synthase, type II
MRYSLVAGGKRFRPVLTLAAAEAVSAADPGGVSGLAEARALALPAACAIEFIHTYSLIHDDLPSMDDDTMRRGRPTLHVVYGEAVAILAGDGLLTEAFSVLCREPAGFGDRKLRVIQTIAEAAGASGMVGGQALDLGAASGGADRETLEAMHASKTGALIRAAAVSGAVMAGGSDRAVAALEAFARHLGLAFQIVDDILDVEGDSDELGKTAGKDAASGKLTYPALVGLDESRRLAAEALDAARDALLKGGITYPRLLDIADWVGARKN